jgi:hypothetical protein
MVGFKPKLVVMSAERVNAELEKFGSSDFDYKGYLAVISEDALANVKTNNLIKKLAGFTPQKRFVCGIMLSFNLIPPKKMDSLSKIFDFVEVFTFDRARLSFTRGDVIGRADRDQRTASPNHILV